MKQTDYVKACLDRLVPQLTGLTITEGAVDDTGEFFGFSAKGQQGGKTVEKTVFVLADPEGNGPGFLEINDGVEPEAPAYTEWCPGCGAETAYRENKPFPCAACGSVLFPCFACYMERGAENVKCSECPWEAKGKEVAHA
ncbi:hypothetical protein [Pontiella sulfatireligans]|uniref:Uncharacterized protein n=1 Tax=Pontiella sulfatireligans TaxID=2750658 RepID=A0A6C2UF07_9BACT|nr:hypothetical protein [Pontiella sulfatireligans]VGO18802.1 hypothetical protein SCARR_00855 [Pontiella sulfatireligans]